MKEKVLMLFVLLMFPLLCWAQTSVNASEIIAKINRGEAVSYKNAVIVGDLDMTRLENMKQQKGNGSKEYVSTVTVPLSFTNCTFKGDVLAYYNPETSNLFNSSDEVYNTNFEESVRFENCKFEEASAFKYSEFKEGASFANSKFSEEGLFKYSKFAKRVDFSNALFREDANFKYVKFPVLVSFAGATFGEEANFKYAEFQEGVNFRKAVFDGTANFKYAKVKDAFDIKGADFRGGDDFKYTQLNNRKVSLASLQSMNR